MKQTCLFGQLAQQCGATLPVEVLESGAGFYIGTADDDGPYSRESMEYWPSREEAAKALDTGTWTQRISDDFLTFLL